ncbi:MAG TPA: hypothetical protein VGE52_17845 [Pirellulales bacterium]
MKTLSRVVAVLALAAGVAYAADKFESGPAAGKRLGPFDVVKVNATEDGVKAGDTLCYFCKYNGASRTAPRVMVFTRQTDEAVASMAKQLDEQVAKNAEVKLAAFINVLAKDKDAADEAAKKLADSAKLANVPVVVPVEFQDGPANYSINPDAQVTVLVYNGGVVKANLSYDKPLSADDVKTVLADVAKQLN